jgi:hypothetical protein
MIISANPAHQAAIWASEAIRQGDVGAVEDLAALIHGSLR